MTNRRGAPSKERVAGGLLLGVVASGALAVTSLASAGVANATCASISGIGDGGGCTSSPTSFAIGLGPGTKANAQGLFTGAIATGTNTKADSVGAFSLAYAGGDNSLAQSRGNLALAFVQGTNAIALAGAAPSDIGNVSINLGNGAKFTESVVQTFGTGNVAANLVGDGNYVSGQGVGNSAFNVAGNGNTVLAIGVLNNATNLVGNGNTVQAFNIPTKLTDIGGNIAFNMFGNGNGVTAGPGPFAIAGVIGKDNLNGPNSVIQAGPGININNS